MSIPDKLFFNIFYCIFKMCVCLIKCYYWIKNLSIIYREEFIFKYSKWLIKSLWSWWYYIYTRVVYKKLFFWFFKSHSLTLCIILVRKNCFNFLKFFEKCFFEKSYVWIIFTPRITKTQSLWHFNVILKCVFSILQIWYKKLECKLCKNYVL